MARGVTLSEMITELRHEANQSADAALGIQSRDKCAHLLRKAQNLLWIEHDWQFLKVNRFEVMADGQRYYDFPSDLDPDQIDRVDYKGAATSNWRPVYRYITTDDLNEVDSQIGEERDGVLKWDLNDDGDQFEVWPMPATNGTNTSSSQSYIIRFHGVRNLSALIEDDDVSTLDGDLIVLQAAVSWLAPVDKGSAEERAGRLQRLMKQLKANSSKRRERGFSMTAPRPEAIPRRKTHIISSDD